MAVLSLGLVLVVGGGGGVVGARVVDRGHGGWGGGHL